MANLFVDLPMPALNGPGASVATSGMGSPKTIVVDGVFSEANVIIEASVDGGVAFAAVTAFQGTGKRTLPLAATHMRVNVSGRKSSLPFACNVDVGANDAGAAFASITMPAGNGSGPAVDVSALANSYTIIAGGTFDGCTILLEVSDDGVGWAPAAQFAGQGGWLQKIVTANWMRATVRGRRAAVPFTGSLAVGAAALTGGGGGGVDLENAGMPLAGGPFDTLNLASALVAVDLGGGTAGIAIAPIPDQTVLGNDSGAPGVPTAVTADQIFDWVSATDGVLLTRTAGVWGAVANWGTEDGDMVVLPNAAPAVPTAPTAVREYAVELGTRTMPAFMNADGAGIPVQPFIGSRQISGYFPPPGGNTMQTLGLTATVQGVPQARTPTATTIATSATRLGFNSGSSPGNTCGVRHGIATFLYLGNAVNRGGFHVCWRFCISDAVLIAGARTYAGIQGSTVGPLDVNPSTLTNIIGVGNDAGQDNLHIFSAGAVAQASTDLGADFPANTTNTDLYEAHVYARPNATVVGYTVIRVGTAFVASGTLAGAQLPTNTTFMTVSAWRSNGGASSVVGIDIAGCYVERGP